ncbi:MAG: hypothetical protein RR630_07375 [Coprobacillus sp.]
MKKIICFIICCVFLVSCQQQEEQSADTDLKEYQKLKSELVNQQQFDSDYPFQVRLQLNQLENKFTYDVIIDNVSTDMYYVKAITYGTENDDQICPNVGIFDNEVYHLKKDFVDKVNHFYKGIQLSGTIKNKQTIKVYIGYYSDKEKINYIENYIEVKDEVR